MIERDVILDDLYTREFHGVRMRLICASDRLDQALARAEDAIHSIEHPEWWADYPDGSHDGVPRRGYTKKI